MSERTYKIHIESISIDQEEYEHLKKIGFRDWVFEQAEARNIQYGYVEGEDKE